MRLRSKFIALYALIFISLLSIVAVSLVTQQKIQAISDALGLANHVLEQSRQVRQITKDLMFASFAPEAYASFKDILYFDNYAVALRNWALEADEFIRLFDLFMNNSVLLNLVERGILRDEYDTAIIMSGKAFDKLRGLQNRVNKIHQAGFLGEDLYFRIQSSNDPDLIALFDETRQTSYYLTNSFESYLKYFTGALRREVDKVRQDLVTSFIFLGLATAFGVSLITLIFASRIVGRLKALGEALKRVSTGDFSTPLILQTSDEFHDLAVNFNRCTDILKTNLASMVSLARRVAEQALPVERHGPEAISDPVASVLAAVVQGSLTNNPDETALLIVQAAAGPQIRYSTNSAIACPWETYLPLLSALENGTTAHIIRDSTLDPGSILAGPLRVVDRCFGVLALCSLKRCFNDLDLIRFENYLEFSGLLADNAAAYSELLEERSAEYQALLSQLRPHFLFNVLGGFAALNHMKDSETLGRSILALKELLRYTVDRGSETSLQEEFLFIQRYCELQKMRFQHRLSWIIGGPEANKDYRIPKLILLPLVENAIIHGLEPKTEGGRVRIWAEMEPPKRLLLTVEDNGVGFNPHKIDRGVGIGNIERRLALAYPDANRSGWLSLESSAGLGTLAHLSLPLEH